MKWFQHDANASSDAKIKKLILKYGTDGYAVYFHCLELIASDITLNNIKFQLEHDAEIVADSLKIRKCHNMSKVDKVKKILEYLVELNLFSCKDNKLYCYKMANRLDNTVSRSPEINQIKSLRRDYVETTLELGKPTKKVGVGTKKLGADKNRIHENTIDKNKEDHVYSKRFKKPTSSEVVEYAKSIEFKIDAEYFCDFYESKGWKVGNQKMKDWKASVRTWKKNNFVTPKKEVTFADKIKGANYDNTGDLFKEK